MNEVIGVYTISNTLSINIYKIENERVLSSGNGEKKRW